MREIGIVEFSEGTYIGEIANGKADGYGRMTYSNGDVYLGEWVSNCQTGQGAKSTANSLAVGTFVNGLKNGKCVAVENRGDTYNNRYYIGNYSNDVRSGHGTLITKNGSYIYYGNFSGGSPNGKGYLGENLGYSDGAFYGGNFVNGDLNGSYYRYPRTSFEYVRGTFHGEVTDNLKHFFGYGALVSDKAYGTIQLGYHNKMNGRELAYNFKGVKVFKHNGTGLSIEEGDWGERVDTIPLDGNFCKIYKNGNVYIGGFVDDKRSGNGIYAKVGSRGLEDVSIRKNGKRYEISKSFSILVKGKFSGGELVDGEKYYDNGEVFVFETWGLTKQPTKNFRTEYRRYNGALNDGSGVRSVGDGSSSVRELVEARLERERQTRQVAAPVVEEPIYAPVEHDYGDEYGENLTFAQKLKLQLQANKENREAKKGKKESAPISTTQATAPQKQTSATIAQQKKDYKLADNRIALLGIITQKEKQQLPNGIKKIMASAFLNDTTVKEIIGGNKIDFIGTGAFEGCVNLEKVDLSKSKITEIKPETFKGCINLKTILLPTKTPIAVYHIDAFEGCPSELRINNKYTAQEYFDEFNVEAAKKKVWEEQARKAREAEAEKERKAKEEEEKKATIVKELGGEKCALNKDEEVYEFNINTTVGRKKVELIGVKKASSKMVIPSYVTYLKEKVFSKNQVIKEIVFDKGNTSLEVGKYAFSGCKNLERVDFSQRELKQIYKEAFKDCTGLKEVILNERFGESFGCLYENTFRKCSSLKTIDLKYINDISYGTFINCTNLEVVKAKHLKTIRREAFVLCTKLKKLTVSKKCKIAKSAFSSYLRIIYKIKDKDTLTLVFLSKGEKLSRAEKKAYIQKVLSLDVEKHITQAEIEAKEAERIAKEKEAAFLIIDGKVQNISKFNEKMEFPEKVYSLGSNLFNGNETVKEISCGNNITIIHDRAFSNCKNLENVFLGKTKIRSVGREAFKNCKNLRTVFLPSSLENVSTSAFENCSSLKYIGLEYTKYIYENAFKNCSSLEKVYAPKVTLIETGAFSGCDNLTTLKTAVNCKEEAGAFPESLKVNSKKEEGYRVYTFTKKEPKIKR